MLKEILQRTFSTGGGSFIKVRDEDGNIDLTCIIASAIRLVLIVGAFYLANAVGVPVDELFEAIGL